MSNECLHAYAIEDEGEYCRKCQRSRWEIEHRLAQPEPAALKHETCLHESKFLGRDGFRCHDCGLWLGMPEPAAETCEAGSSGWIKHSGGDCPVHPNSIVDVHYANGHESLNVLASAARWIATNDNDGADLIFYRVVGRTDEAAEFRCPLCNVKFGGPTTEHICKGANPLPPEPLARDMTVRDHMRLELTKAALTGLLAGNYKDNTDVRWVKLRAQLYAEELLAALQEKPNAP